MTVINKKSIELLTSELSILLEENNTNICDYITWYARKHDVIRSAKIGAMYKLWFHLSQDKRNYILDISECRHKHNDKHLDTALNTVYIELQKRINNNV